MNRNDGCFRAGCVTVIFLSMGAYLVLGAFFAWQRNGLVTIRGGRGAVGGAMQVSPGLAAAVGGVLLALAVISGWQAYRAKDLK